MGTGREQKITITASSGLSKDEIDRMMRDAESHSAEDATKRDRTTPPVPHLPKPRDQRQAVENLVENILKSQGNIMLDSP